MLVVGILLALIGLALLAGGGALGIAYLGHRDDEGFFTTSTERFETTTYALASEVLDLADHDLPPFLDAEDFGRILVRGESLSPGHDLFIGIGPEEDVNRYLEGVTYAQVTNVDFDPFEVDYEVREGSAAPAPPADQQFWVAR